MARARAVEPMAATPAAIRLLCGAAPQGPLRTLGPEFERATGHKVELTFDIVSEIQRRLAAGETADAIILPVSLLAVTAKTLSLRAEGRLILARVGIGVIVHRNARRPDISTVEAVRTALLDAHSIAWPDPGTPIGNHLNQVIVRLGIDLALRPKLIVKAVIHGGRRDCRTWRGRSRALPRQRGTVCQRDHGGGSAAATTAALRRLRRSGSELNKAPKPALAFLEFISSPDKAERWRGAGFELAGASIQLER